MAVRYSNILSTDLIVAEAEGLSRWQAAVLRGAVGGAVTPAGVPPHAVLSLCEKEAERLGVGQQAVGRLQLVYADLSRLGDEVQAATLPVDIDLYDRFTAQVTTYLATLRSVYHELADRLGAVDTVTGLRTPSGLKAELRREQDRFDRKGTPFSIASLVIDRVDDLRQTHSGDVMNAVYAGVAQTIAAAVRSFDDAYYLGDGEYLVVLKHVEFMDACSAMDRLNGDIARGAAMMPDGTSLEVTASIGLAEAQERENPDMIIDYAKAARREAQAAGGNQVREYHERSALESFARDINRDR